MPTNPFKDQSYMNLETRRKNGEPVQTPVWFLQDGELFYFRTISTSGKVKRLLAKRQVRIAPCKVDGALLGEWMAAEWIPLDAFQAEQLHAVYNKKYSAEIAAITSRDMQNKLRANQGYAVRLLPDS